MFKGKRVAAVVPAYNEAALIDRVIRNMPQFIDNVIVIDDKSTDDSARIVSESNDARISLIRHETNQGLGATLVSGYEMALNLGADLVVVMAGDDQMDPHYLPHLLGPICDGSTDVTKGNRYFSRASLRHMPRHRVIGGLVLTWLTRLASGYWRLHDSQNGYVAFSVPTLRKVRLRSLATGYAVENAMLIELGRVRARVLDVPIPARYGSEQSTMRLIKVVPAILGTILAGLAGRIYRAVRR